MDKNTRPLGPLALLLALFAMVAVTLSACGDDDPISGTGNDYGDQFGTSTSHYRVDYTLTLADRHVLDVADVAVLYRDSLGQMISDTLTSEAWATTVNYARAVNIQCVFAAKYTMKPSPQFAHDEYNFAMTMQAPTTRIYTNGKFTYVGSLHFDGATSLLHGTATPTLSAAYLSTPTGRARVDTTMMYINQTMRLDGGAIDTISHHGFEWPDY